MPKLSDLALDDKAIEEGTWFDYPDVDGVRVCVRSTVSEAYRKRRAQLMDRMKPGRRKVGRASQEMEDVERRAAADLLVAWEGIDDEAGNPIEFSLDTARKMAAEKRYWTFFERIRELADEVGQAERTTLEETVRD